MHTAFVLAGDPPLSRLRILGELDLAAVTFIDASNLRVLRQQQCRLLASGGAMDVVAASHRHQLVAHLAGYDTLLAPAPTPATRARAAPSRTGSRPS